MTIGIAGVIGALALGGIGTHALAGSPEPLAAPPVAAGELDTSHAATAADWVVLGASGECAWRPQGGGAWQPAVNGQVLPAGSEVETGPAGDLILVVGGDRLVVASDSRIVIPARERAQDRQLRIERGRMRVDVESRPGRSVEVRTPLLSLGIKGTSIELALDREQDSVLVLEGRITTTPGDGPPEELGAGEGLRQRSAPGAAPERLDATDLPAAFDRNGPVRWQLPAPDSSAELDESTPGPFGAAVASPAGIDREPATRSQGARASERTGGPLGGWSDDRASLLTILLVAAGGAIVLIVPGMVLGQNLRQHWRERPRARGRRRHSLTQG